MTKKNNNFNDLTYNPDFKFNFFAPKYWTTWLGIIIICFTSFIPKSIQYSIAKGLTYFAVKFKSGAAKRARVNLSMCFPEKTEKEQKDLLSQMYITAIMFIMNFASLSIRNKIWLERRTEIRGFENIQNVLDSGDNVILLVPHTWAIDIPAVLFASKGFPVSAMAKSQKNQLADWFMHKQRVQHGGRVYDRSVGIKPFIKSIRKDNYLGYYLPDEDLGKENSVFVDFFATQKATISGLGRISKLSRAKIVPLFAMFNTKTATFEIDVYPALPFPTGNEYTDARIMNKCIETYVYKHPEQYMWILRLLKTRPNDDKNPYK